MRGLSGGSDDGNFTAKVFYEAASNRRSRTTPTGKLIAALHTAFDSMSFDPKDWAFVFSLSSAEVQRRFLNSLVHYFEVLAERADSNLYRNETERLLVEDGRTIYNAIRFLKD